MSSEAERKDKALEEYGKVYAQAITAGITTAQPPAVVAYTFAENAETEAALIENATRELREAVEYREWEKIQAAENKAEVVEIMERGAKKSQSAHDKKISELRRELDQVKREKAQAEKDRAQAQRERDAARKAILGMS